MVCVHSIVSQHSEFLLGDVEHRFNDANTREHLYSRVVKYLLLLLPFHFSPRSRAAKWHDSSQVGLEAAVKNIK